MSSTIKVTTDQVRLSAYQVCHDQLRELLRGAARAVLDSGGGMGSVGWRACAALDALLAAHPVDRVGRCGRCRRRGSFLHYRRHSCLVHIMVRYWLRQPDEVLGSFLSGATASGKHSDPEDTQISSALRLLPDVPSDSLPGKRS